MSLLKIHKVTALPQNLEPNSIYLVASSSKPQFIEMYVTGTSANTVKRNALNLTQAMFVLILDETGDPSVSQGSASYIFNPGTEQWIKVAEYESMDLVLNWSSIQG